MLTNIQKNLRDLRRVYGVTQRDVAEVVGLSPQAVSAWEHGRNMPDVLQLEALADHFGFTVSAFVQEDGVARSHGLPAAESPSVYTATTKAPLYGRIAAGKPMPADAVEDSFWVPPAVLQEHPRGFYLRVEGESMNRVIPDGSLAFVDPDCDVRNGDIGALHVNGDDATIKRVMRGSTKLMLVPESFDPEFHDTVFDLNDPKAETVTIIGRVVWFTRPYEGGCL